MFFSVIPPETICTMEPKESTGSKDILSKKMLFNQDNQGLSLTFEGSTNENMSALLTAHPNGYWDIGGLQVFWFFFFFIIKPKF